MLPPQCIQVCVYQIGYHIICHPNHYFYQSEDNISNDTQRAATYRDYPEQSRIYFYPTNKPFSSVLTICMIASILEEPKLLRHQATDLLLFFLENEKVCCWFQTFNLPKDEGAIISLKTRGKAHSEDTVSYFFLKHPYYQISSLVFPKSLIIWVILPKLQKPNINHNVSYGKQSILLG